MMKTIIFVCHGNICRSVAAEYIMENKLIKYHMDEFNIFQQEVPNINLMATSIGGGLIANYKRL